MRLERVEEQSVLAWRSVDGNWAWSFILREADGRTRLISRNRYRLPSPLAKVGMLAMEPASLVMEAKMLAGIGRRAERLAAEGAAQALCSRTRQICSIGQRRAHSRCASER